METIIIITLLVIAAEVTYLVAVNTKKLTHGKSKRHIFVDTSVLIDGRIIAVAQSGFIGDTLSIPRSVIGELQFLADNADSEKRSRARHGLDVVTELQRMPGVSVEIFQDGSKAEEGVDERLLMLAAKHHGAICTIDYNLNKVAQVEGITVLNVNDLAMSLRMAYLPGEKMMLELIQKGQDGHQAVGHLTDGTMVVVEHASSYIGKTVEIEFIRSLQTAAGKMMFAKMAGDRKSDKKDEPLKKIVKAVRSNTRSEKTTPARQPKAQIAPEVPVAMTFHSDSNDRRLAYKNKSTSRTKDPSTKPRDNRSQPQQSAPSRSSKKPRTSAQNEQDLINLLNNQ
ncbi:MAG TPA: hypothetical protein VFS65_02000 [Candidatus Saccharimonadales bacterium]|nr:hypothetical protein [Candidatus Saccharimonadales bacterium]